MRKITVSVDDETYRLARIKAAENGTSVSAMVREYLNSLTEMSTRAPDITNAPEMTLSEVIEAIFARGGGLDPRDNLTREELHDRNAFR